ncbi:MAG: YidC/Oxa1 family membrane protein insertase [Clostridiales bacterium]|nr:YidC/Oxa1 family membrane protein insertase [Clostridiales bacterium]
MNAIFAPLYWLFGVCMSFLMDLLNNEYFLAITIFVILTRLVMLPLDIRQQRTTAKSSRIQAKHARTNMNEEMQALYARENHNPMTIGCGPMLIQMLFLWGIIGVIYYPLTYVLSVPESSLEIMIEALNNLDVDVSGRYQELAIMTHFNDIREAVAGSVDASYLDAIGAYRDSLTIGGMDLTQTPSFKLEPLVIVPLLSLLTSLASSLYSSFVQRRNNPGAAQQNSQMMMMTLTMPLFSLFIAFQVPAAVGIYWAISNLVSMLKQVLLTQAMPVRKITAKTMIEGTIERRSREEHLKRAQS